MLTLFGGGDCGFSTVGVGAIVWHGCGIQGQNFVALLLESERVYCRILLWKLDFMYIMFQVYHVEFITWCNG